MAQRAGSANLPLHSGQVPGWLADRMTRLGAVISEAIVHHYGRDELLRRLAHPFWFQSFGAVMGMDWHSSGITTSVIGVLKRGLRPLAADLGIHVCGGRGKHSRQTPHELIAIGERVGFDGGVLARTSERARLTLGRAFARPSNVLALDEPTNDLDLETLDLLQELLADYPGTVLLVSHDRDFLDRVVTSVITKCTRWLQ